MSLGNPPQIPTNRTEAPAVTRPFAPVLPLLRDFESQKAPQGAGIGGVVPDTRAAFQEFGWRSIEQILNTERRTPALEFTHGQFRAVEDQSEVRGRPGTHAGDRYGVLVFIAADIID